ncbi:MAG: stage V sporulation protein SpoVM [Ruminococcus sp.]|nr:stage V sporulation protein SpoVM [Ruminococcus sp.]
MKIVVVKSPKLLSGIFRVIFKIRKESSDET